MFAKLNQITGKSLIRIGYGAYVIHNAIKRVVVCRPFNIQCKVIKSYYISPAFRFVDYFLTCKKEGGGI